MSKRDVSEGKKFEEKRAKILTNITKPHNFELKNNDIYIIPAMCILCVAIPFVLVTIAPRYITGAEVNLFFLLETILGPIWVWMVIKEQPSPETILGGIVIIITIAIHSFLAIKKTQLKSTQR